MPSFLAEEACDVDQAERDAQEAVHVLVGWVSNDVGVRRAGSLLEVSTLW